MPMKNPWNESGVSRRDLLRLGAGGLGLGLFGGIGPVPTVFAQATRSVAANPTGKILVVFEWFGGNDGLNTIVPYGDPSLLQASADDRDQRIRRSENRRAVRLAQVDARHEEPLRRGEGRDRAGRRLRPAVVLALHLDIVLAHGGAEQRQRVRLGRAHGVEPRPDGRAREHDREHLRTARRSPSKARSTCRSCSCDPDDVPARRVRSGESRPRYARRARHAGR